MRVLLTTAALALSTPVIAADAPPAGVCPANAPEGYKWLSGYVDEYRTTGKIPDWFKSSLKDHPKDQALVALNAYFKGKGDWDKGWKVYSKKGGKAANYANGLACAKVSP